MSLLIDLISYYKLDNGSGSTAVDAHGENNGTLNSGVSWNADGKLGSHSAEFDGSDCQIQLFDVSSAAAFTYNVWVKYTATGDGFFIVQSNTLAASNLNESYIRPNFPSAGHVSFRVRRGTVLDVSGTYNDGNWHMFTLVYNGSSVAKAYIDGVEENDVNIGTIHETRRIMLGQRFDNSSDVVYDGQQDEVGIWSRALTGAEVSELYNSGDALSYDSFGDPAVTTQAATSITKFTATANGNVTSVGEEASVEAGHQFRVKNESEWTNTATQSLSATGAYTTSLTGLDLDTEYEVRSRITWDSGAEEAFGDVVEFTTDPLDAPTVTTQAATAIGEESATLNGNLTNKGDFDPVDTRFQYRATGSGTWLETSLNEDVATGAYTFGLTGLTPETQYEFRAKVEYDTDQEVFGDTLEFTTLEGVSAPSVTTNAMTEIRATYATANGDVTSDGGEAVTERGFVWATTTAPDVTDNKVEVAGTTGVYSVKLTALPLETIIYLRTYAINSEGTSYGNEVEFTTLSLEDVRNPVYIKDGDNLRRI